VEQILLRTRFDGRRNRAIRMNRIIIRLPRNRDFAGQLEVVGSFGRSLAGPFSVCGRADDDFARAHGNPRRDRLLPFGDAPLGDFHVARIIPSGNGTPYNGPEFGSAGIVLLQPTGGEAALADANGRFGIFIQAGAAARGGALYPTRGSLRLSNRDQHKLIAILGRADDVLCSCIEWPLGIFKGGARIARAAGGKKPGDPMGDASWLEPISPEPTLGATRRSWLRTILLATGGYALAGSMGFGPVPAFADTATAGTDYGGNIPATQPPITVAQHAEDAIAAFVAENPGAKDAAYLPPGGGNRTVAEQEAIILDPRNAANYPNIKASLEKQFNLDSVPAYASLTADQKTWLDSAVNAQAGKPGGFAHVGGNAQDVSVKSLTVDQKNALLTKLTQGGYGVLNENYADNKSTYGVKIEDANVFHVYQKPPATPKKTSP
jgi:hypothetical protein